MIDLPVILLAFANEQELGNPHRLRNIPVEQRLIYSKLREAEKNRLCRMVLLPYATIDCIFEAFQEPDLKGKIIGFHFGGHANSYHLLLESESASSQLIHGDGLASFLGRQEGLQFVFLNACSTEQHAEKMIEAGVPAVIATRQQVNDQVASRFAFLFYQAVARLHSLSEAFQLTHEWVTSENGISSKPGQASAYRDLYYEGMEPLGNEGVPWKLYVAAGNQLSLNWKLDSSAAINMQNWFLGRAEPQEVNEEVNKLIVEPLYQEMLKINPKLAALAYDEDEDDEDVRMEELQHCIIKNFPLPISSELRRLFSDTDNMVHFGRPRLEQLVRTYQVCSQLMAYVLLSQTWQEWHKRSEDERKVVKAKAREGWLDFQSYSILDNQSQEDYNYVLLMRACSDLLNAMEADFFIEEFASLTEERDQEGSFFQAYTFMRTLKTSLIRNDELVAKNIELLCLEGEKSMGVILCNLAFLVQYRLVSVKEISFMKYLNREPEYAHNMRILKGFDGALSKEKVRTYKGSFTDSHSVVMVKDVKDLTEYLNLSPFIIDLHTYREKPTKELKLHFLKSISQESIFYDFFKMRKGAYQMGHSIHQGLYEIRFGGDRIQTNPIDASISHELLSRLVDLNKMFTKDFDIL